MSKEHIARCGHCLGKNRVNTDPGWCAHCMETAWQKPCDLCGQLQSNYGNCDKCYSRMSEEAAELADRTVYLVSTCSRCNTGWESDGVKVRRADLIDAGDAEPLDSSCGACVRGQLVWKRAKIQPRWVREFVRWSDYAPIRTQMRLLLDELDTGLPHQKSRAKKEKRICVKRGSKNEPVSIASGKLLLL